MENIMIGKKKKMLIISSVIFLIIAIITPIYCYNQVYSRRLIAAIDNDDIEGLKSVLERKGNINSKPTLLSLPESNNDPALLYACWLGKFDAAMMLLEYGADPNIEKKGESALMLCGYNNSKDSAEKMLLTVQSLIEHGADVNYRENKGNGASVLSRLILNFYTAINKYTDEEIYEILKILLDNGVDCEDILLFDFAYKNYDFIRDIVTVRNADVNVVGDKLQNSPLIVAVRANAKESVELLLANGADKTHQNSENKTALDYATESGDADLISLLSQ
jgi:ankyrin repeat protein